MAVSSVFKRPLKALDRFGGRHPIIFVSIIVILVLLGVGYWAYNRPLPAIQPVYDIKSQPASGTVPPPNIVWSPYGEQAISAAGQNIVLTHGGQKIMPTASVAKVITCLAILKQKPLQLGQPGPTITMTQADADIYNADLSGNQSIVPVNVGEQITEYQALQAILIPSGTNIATSLATWAFGSLDNFLSYTNKMVSDNGWLDTHLVDASGYLPGSVSSPSDLLKIGAAAMQNPVIAQIVGQKSAVLPVAGTVRNYNIVLGQSGINGIKTGNTDQAGGVYLYSATYGGLTLIGITMGAPDLGTAMHDAPEIISSFESAVKVKTILNANQPVAHYDFPWGGQVAAVTQKPLAILQWSGAQPGTRADIANITTKDQAGGQVGTVSVIFNGQTQSVPVLLKQTPPMPNLWWRLFR